MGTAHGRNSVQRNAPAVEAAAKLSLVATILVVTIKVVAAIVSGSVSVLAEAMQSSLDVVVVVGVLQAIRVANKPPDPDHPYGHGKVELLMSAAQMTLVLIASGVILYQAVTRLSNPHPIEAISGAIAMSICIVIDLVIAARLALVARETGSSALASESVHLRSDAFATVGVLAGLVAVRVTGRLWLDPVMAGIFTLLSIRMAVRTLLTVIHPLIDGALPRDEVERVEKILATHPDVRGYHNLRTRQVGSTRFVELHAMLEDTLSFIQAHELTEVIEDELRNALGGAVVTIHYEPHEQEMLHQKIAHQ